MIMHKCNYMYMYNYYLALHSDGGEGRSAGSRDVMICDVGRRRVKREGEIRGGRRCGAMASERDCECARRVEGRGWRGAGGGLAAAVTSSFMNSLYFCSVQNKRTFLLKKMKKEKKTKNDHSSRLLLSHLRLQRSSFLETGISNHCGRSFYRRR